ncbi:hypothetical protein [Salinarchaeum laminariae]|uniref:hypothetical protein n=1 Tax=Salinarchaeum laminariae TaxID=869888 RepID=UPI0020C02FE3|nr:hypothetical protein [Salinarchaeum laminariae]
MRTRVALVLCLLAVAALAVALPAVAQDDTTGTENGSVDNVTLGQSISGFMQSTEASTEGDVDQGVYQAKYAAANQTEKAALVEAQTNDLANRLAAIEERVENLKSQRENMSPTAYRAQISGAAAQLQSIESSVNATETDAIASGVNTSKLETLRQNASELSGQQVASIARGLAGASNGGPPENPGNGQGPPNGTPGESGNGPPDDPGEGAGNGSTGAGNGTNSGNGTGPNTGTGNGAGAGNGNGNGANTGNGNGPDAGNRNGANTGNGNGPDAGNGNGANTGNGNGPDAGNGNGPGSSGGNGHSGVGALIATLAALV